MRESWHYPWIGSCLESVIGGNHFRAWKQNGTGAANGAWFLAASKEVVSAFLGPMKERS